MPFAPCYMLPQRIRFQKNQFTAFGRPGILKLQLHAIKARQIRPLVWRNDYQLRRHCQQLPCERVPLFFGTQVHRETTYHYRKTAPGVTPNHIVKRPGQAFRIKIPPVCFGRERIGCERKRVPHFEYHLADFTAAATKIKAATEVYPMPVAQQQLPDLREVRVAVVAAFLTIVGFYPQLGVAVANSSVIDYRLLSHLNDQIF